MRSALPDVYSINAKPNVVDALAIFFGCYDPRVPLIAVMMDPNNNRMEYLSHDETIVFNGHEMHCDADFFVVFILHVKFEQWVISKGFCMYKTSALERIHLKLAAHEKHISLAYFRELPQPVEQNVYEEAQLYTFFVNDHMRQLNRQRRQAEEARLSDRAGLGWHGLFLTIPRWKRQPLR